MPPFWRDFDKTWEVEPEVWDDKRQAVREVLEDTARCERTVPYSVIAQRVGGFAGPNSHALAELLGEVSAQNHEEGLGLLSAVATFKHDPNQVGVGFFNIAQQLRGDVPVGADLRLSYWLRELWRVHADYR